MRKVYVYIAGPYTNPDPIMNVRKAIFVADRLLLEGMVPYIPHLTMLQHLVSPQPYEVWLQRDRDWIGRCDVLLRIPGESKGADWEVEEARRLGMPIYHDIGQLIYSFKRGL